MTQAKVFGLLVWRYTTSEGDSGNAYGQEDEARQEVLDVLYPGETITLWEPSDGSEILREVREFVKKQQKDETPST